MSDRMRLAVLVLGLASMAMVLGIVVYAGGSVLGLVAAFSGAALYVVCALVVYHQGAGR